MADRTAYDTSIGTEERSVKSATKLWAIVFAAIFLIGVTMILVFYSWSGDDARPGGVGGRTDTENVGP